MKAGRRFSAVLAFILITLSASGLPSRAQSIMGGPTQPLPFNQTVTGSISRGDTLTYTFDIPANQDVAVVLESDKRVVDYPCTLDGCGSGGSSGGDSPTLIAEFYQATDNPTLTHTVEVSLGRPLEGTAAFRLTAYTATPTPLLVDGWGKGSADAPIQAYTLQSNDIQLFSVEIEDAEDDGQFLWVASQPYIYGTYSEAGDTTVPNGVVDTAFAKPENGLRFMQLYHVSGQTYRVYVSATVDYLFHTKMLSIPELERDQFMTVNVSYRQPIQVLYLSTLHNDVANIYLNVTQGVGAFASVYTLGNTTPSYHALGMTPNSSLKTALSYTIKHPAKTNWGTYAVIQVPAEFTRDEATVQVLWNLGR